MSNKIINLRQAKEVRNYTEWFLFCSTLLNIFHCIYTLIISKCPSRENYIGKKILVKREETVVFSFSSLIDP